MCDNKLLLPILMVGVIAAAVLFFFTLTGLSGWLTRRRIAKLRSPQRGVLPAVKRTEAPNELQSIVFRPWLCDVEPLPMRVMDFSKGKIEGRLVMHGDKTLKRFVMMWKGEKYSSTRMTPVNVVDLEQTTKASLEEAMEIANKVFGKKNKGNGAQAAVKPVAVVAAAVLPPLVVPAAVKPSPPTAVVEEPLKKGFKAAYEGYLLAEGIMPHTITKNGKAETYTSYTAKLNVNGDVVNVQGNDIRRALADASAEVGDLVNLVHVRSDSLPGNKTRKVYACSVLQRRASAPSANATRH